MKIGVVGGGSLGLLFAARLGGVAEDVQTIMYTRTAEQAELLRSSGIELHEEGECTVAAAMPLFEARMSGQRPDWLLLAVKQGQLDDRLAEDVKPLAAAAEGVVCMQNGIGHLERLSIMLPGVKLAAAVTTEGALRHDLRTVRHTGRGETWLGWAGGGCDGLEILAYAMERAGFSTFVTNHIVERIWKKLAVNAAINPLTALLRVPNGELLRSPELMTLTARLLQELRQVAAAEGCLLDDEQLLVDSIIEVCRRTAGNRSSMLQDRERGIRTEIDWLNGAVVQLADKHGIEATCNRTLVQLVKGFERLDLSERG